MNATHDAKGSDVIGGPLVLVVEDEALIRFGLADALAAAGCHALEAATADEALRTLERFHDQISLLMTDILLPGALNGLDLATFVRKRWPPTGIVVFSGYHVPRPGELPAGAKFFRKPYLVDAVVAAVCDLIH